MSFIKFNILTLFLLMLCLVSSESWSFTIDECLQSKNTSIVKRKGWPFGLYDIVLNVKKDKCLIEIEHTKMKYLKNKWTVDVCRGPIHVKKGTKSVEVVKRKSACPKGKESDGFCAKYNEIINVLQDDGLIFASGQKEDIATDHGRIYCVFKLMEVYLAKGKILSLNPEENTNLESSFSLSPSDASKADQEPIEVENLNETTQEIPAKGRPADF